MKLQYASYREILPSDMIAPHHIGILLQTLYPSVPLRPYCCCPPEFLFSLRLLHQCAGFSERVVVASFDFSKVNSSQLGMLSSWVRYTAAGLPCSELLIVFGE
jgi:hypothetical protein